MSNFTPGVKPSTPAALARWQEARASDLAWTREAAAEVAQQLLRARLRAARARDAKQSNMRGVS